MGGHSDDLRNWLFSVNKSLPSLLTLGGVSAAQIVGRPSPNGPLRVTKTTVSRPFDSRLIAAICAVCKKLVPPPHCLCNLFFYG
jgi:hypothetical protein